MATWISNYLACLGLDIVSFEPYITGVLYDENLSEEDKTATIYECLETSCPLVRMNGSALGTKASSGTTTDSKTSLQPSLFLGVL